MARTRKTKAKGKGSQANGKTIFQATPIVIKGGESLHIRSDLVRFEDDDGKRVPHVMLKNKGSIDEISIVGSIDHVTGDGSELKPFDIKLKGKIHVISLNFVRES